MLIFVAVGLWVYRDSWGSSLLFLFKNSYMLCLIIQLCSTLCNPMCPWWFSRQEYWSGLACPPPGHLPNPEIESRALISPSLARGFFTTSWEDQKVCSRGLTCRWDDQKSWSSGLNFLLSPDNLRPLRWCREGFPGNGEHCRRWGVRWPPAVT